MGTSVIPSPDARLLMLGAGVFLINEQDESGNATFNRHMGNIGSGELTQTVTRITKRESMTRARNVYLDLQKDQTFELRLVLDEWSAKNIGLYLRGSIVQTAAQAGAAVPDGAWIASVHLGGVYLLPGYGPYTAVTLKVGATPLVVGTDYTINLETGMVTFLPAAVNVTDLDAVTAAYTPAAYASGLTQIHAGSRKNVRGALTFIGDPQNGPRLLTQIWKASIRADANAALISAPDATDTTPLTLVATVEADVVNHPESPIFTQTILGG